MIRKAGYPVETHTVQTEDGYLLTLYRIPRQNGAPVLLQHGLLTSSADFLILGKDKGLGMTYSTPKSISLSKRLGFYLIIIKFKNIFFLM